jgi:hypothetical protein
VTLPYSFRQIPSSLPPSIIEDLSSDKPKYITSSSGHTAHPDDIINSCNALQQHITENAENSKRVLEEWEQSIKTRELAEKRRVAPGWLDREEKILEPAKAINATGQDLLDGQAAEVKAPAMSPSREGEEIDKAFGNLAIK